MSNSTRKPPPTRQHTLRGIAAGLSLLAASSAALAQPDWGGDPHSQRLDGPRHGAPYGARMQRGVQRGVGPEAAMLRGLAMATDRLELDAEQETRIREILDDARGQMQANREAAGELREELRGIVTAEPFDEDALAEAAEREGDLSAERVMIAGTASASILATLTEEQRAELELMREEARERMRERRGSRRG